MSARGSAPVAPPVLAPAVAVPAALTLRIAAPEALPDIARLAALDSSSPPEPPVLTAAVDGEICVAVSLVDLHTVADPFRFTTAVREITLARAHQLRDQASTPVRRLRRLGAQRQPRDRARQPQSAV